MGILVDPFGRKITYLRIAVTDRCNFRCVYCMPPEGIRWQPHENILRYEEILEVVRVAAEEGIREVRLTGGEPLVRAGIENLIRMIAAVPGIEDISLTTNGMLLEKMAPKLAEAGLKRINMSLDTLNPEKFKRITRGADLNQVLKGLYTADAVGIAPIKINTVAMRGVNDDELLDLASLTLKHPWQVRFIELMPIGNQEPWGVGFPSPRDAYLPIQEIHELLAPLGLRPIEREEGSGPAQLFQIDSGLGRIGFISPLGEKFCQQCNRLRLTADGCLRPCLGSAVEVPLASALREGQPILPLLQKAVALKPESHSMGEDVGPAGRCMIQIGG